MMAMPIKSSTVISHETNSDTSVPSSRLSTFERGGGQCQKCNNLREVLSTNTGEFAHYCDECSFQSYCSKSHSKRYADSIWDCLRSIRNMKSLTRKGS